MNQKNTIRLTESELKRVISESVMRILNENDENYNEGKIYYDDAWSIFNNLNKALNLASEALERSGFTQDEPLLSKQYADMSSRLSQINVEIEQSLSKHSKMQMYNNIEIEEDLDFLERVHSFQL